MLTDFKTFSVTEISDTNSDSSILLLPGSNSNYDFLINGAQLQTPLKTASVYDSLTVPKSCGFSEALPE